MNKKGSNPDAPNIRCKPSAPPSPPKLYRHGGHAMNDNIKNYYAHVTNNENQNIFRGWKRLIENLCKNIIALDDSVRVLQVKQKFGSLCFYYKEGKKIECRAEIRDLVYLAQSTSTGICEVCGSFEFVSTDTGLYVQALCRKCRKKLL